MNLILKTANYHERMVAEVIKSICPEVHTQINKEVPLMSQLKPLSPVGTKQRPDIIVYENASMDKVITIIEVQSSPMVDAVRQAIIRQPT